MLLARTRRPSDQNAHISASGGCDSAVHFLHSWRATNDCRQWGFSISVACGGYLTLTGALAGLPNSQPIQINRLGQVIKRTLLDRFDSSFNRAVRGGYDDR